MRVPLYRVRTLMIVVASIAIGFATAPKTRVAGTIVDGATPPVEFFMPSPTWEIVANATAIGLCVFVVLAIVVCLGSKLSRRMGGRGEW